MANTQILDLESTIPMNGETNICTGTVHSPWGHTHNFARDPFNSYIETFRLAEMSGNYPVDEEDKQHESSNACGSTKNLPAPAHSEKPNTAETNTSFNGNNSFNAPASRPSIASMSAADEELHALQAAMGKNVDWARVPSTSWNRHLTEAREWLKKIEPEIIEAMVEFVTKSVEDYYYGTDSLHANWQFARASSMGNYLCNKSPEAVRQNFNDLRVRQMLPAALFLFGLEHGARYNVRNVSEGRQQVQNAVLLWPLEEPIVRPEKLQQLTDMQQKFECMPDGATLETVYEWLQIAGLPQTTDAVRGWLRRYGCHVGCDGLIRHSCPSYRSRNTPSSVPKPVRTDTLPREMFQPLSKQQQRNWEGYVDLHFGQQPPPNLTCPENGIFLCVSVEDGSTDALYHLTEQLAQSFSGNYKWFWYWGEAANQLVICMGKRVVWSELQNLVESVNFRTVEPLHPNAQYYISLSYTGPRVFAILDGQTYFVVWQGDSSGQYVHKKSPGWHRYGFPGAIHTVETTPLPRRQMYAFIGFGTKTRALPFPAKQLCDMLVRAAKSTPLRHWLVQGDPEHRYMEINPRTARAR